tara:strand:- start:1245 stop:2216 length:972 start_codon:yes stop_codon:yes gene_type:complete
VFKKYSFNKQINFTEYDEIIDSSPQGTIFSKSYFLKFFKINHQIWNVKQGTQTKAVICLITSKDNKKVILNDHAIYGGVIFNIDSTRIETKRRSEEFKILEFIIENLTKKFKKIDIQLSPELHDIRPFQWFNYHKKKLKKFEIETKFTSYIKISNKDFKNFLKSNLYNQMETVRRYDYRSALKEGAKLVTSNDISVFIKYYSYMFRKEKSVSSEYLKKIGNSISNLMKINKGQMFHVEDKDGNILYTLFYIWDEKKAYYFLGAGNPKMSSPWQGVFGHCEIFKYLNKKYAINLIDLEGVNSPLRGWFKLSLGGKLVSYFRVKI